MLPSALSLVMKTDHHMQDIDETMLNLKMKIFFLATEDLGQYNVELDRDDCITETTIAFALIYGKYYGSRKMERL